ncbi:MAG: hypothetical protein ABIK19_01390 [candidate division WOR-3 bacterium]
MALISILNIALSYLSLGGQTIERTTAIFLAREGIELVRAIRDSQWLNPMKVWPYGLDDNDSDYDEYWIIDYDDTNLTEAIFSPPNQETVDKCTNCQLYLTPSGQYTHSASGNTQTVFKRLIHITNGDDLGAICPDPSNSHGCEKKVESIVYWTERGRSHQITLESRLTDWR